MIFKQDFMCVCRDESREVAETALKRVMKDVKSSHPDYGIASHFTYELQWNMPYASDAFDNGIIFTATLAGIPCDMWSSVNVYIYRCDFRNDDEKEVKVAEIRVQCDLVEHGMARALELTREAMIECLKAEYGEEVKIES